MRSRVAGLTPAVGFQCSSASRKFLNSPDCRSRRQSRRVSVLFSEPKIPHAAAPRRRSRPPGFSALQRAENSSVRAPVHRYAPVLGFSALQRAENSSFNTFDGPLTIFESFSALQRAENSSTDPRTCVHPYSRLRRSRFVVPEPSWCVAMTPVY